MEIDTHDDTDMGIFQDISLVLIKYFERKRSIFVKNFKCLINCSMAYPLTTFKVQIYDKKYKIGLVFHIIPHINPLPILDPRAKALGLIWSTELNPYNFL